MVPSEVACSLSSCLDLLFIPKIIVRIGLISLLSKNSSSGGWLKASELIMIRFKGLLIVFTEVLWEVGPKKRISIVQESQEIFFVCFFIF